MANLMDLLQGQLSDGLIDSLTNRIGGADKQQTGSAANLVMQTLLNAVAQNAKTPEGAQALAGALERDHDGGILSNVLDMVTGNGQVANTKSADGFGILSHLLGNNLFNVVEMVSKGSGVNRSGAMDLMMKLAPVVLGVLGQQKKQQNMQPNNLMDFLNQSQQQVSQKSQGNDLITKILDRDGDGSAMNEIAGMGMKLLGGLFSK